MNVLHSATDLESAAGGSGEHAPDDRQAPSSDDDAGEDPLQQPEDHVADNHHREAPGFTLTLTGGDEPVSAMALTGKDRIAVISNGVARWLLPDGTLGDRLGGRHRCSGRAVALAGAPDAIAVLYDEPAGLAVISAGDHYVTALEGLEMPVANALGIALSASRLAISAPRDRVYLFDRRTFALSRTLEIPGAESLSAAADDSFWAATPRTGRVVNFGETGELLDALSGFAEPGAMTIRNGVAVVASRTSSVVDVRAINPAIRSSTLSDAQLVQATGAIVLPDGAVLVGQETRPYLLRFEPPR
jgi:hypothetical protein